MIGGTFISTVYQIGTGVLPLTKVTAQTVTGAAVTSITLASLDLETDGWYQLFVDLKHTNSNSVYLYVNGDTTANHYYQGNIITNAYQNSLDPIFYNSVAAAGESAGYIQLSKLAGMHGHYFATSGSYREASGECLRLNEVLTNNTTNWTSLTLTGAANRIDIGSRVALLKYVGGWT